MAAPTLNLNLNVPDNGDDLGIWDQPVNQNWGIIDSLFSGVASTSPGGSGHTHNSTPGQGPQLSHLNLTEIGSRTHPILETEIDGLGTRLAFVETTYCSDILCGSGVGGGGGGATAGANLNSAPVNYTDNFTTARGTKLGTNDWLVSSDSTLDLVETTGRSAFMFLDPLLLGTPWADRYAAVVHAQVPHSTAQRCTFALTRFTAGQMQDNDSFTMVIALMSTHLLGSSTPFIHYCGIKFILTLSNSGGIFTVTREAVAEVTDGVFTVVMQDSISGLTYQMAEQYVRGVHEFSMAKDGGLWYYLSHLPVWIMPPGTVAQYYGQIQQTLLGLTEPAFGSIGFGYSWNIKPSTVIDVEMSWFTLDSDNDVEEEYASKDFPPNWPRPYDPEPPLPCCDGAGPNVGDDFDVFNDGTVVEKIVAKIGEVAFRLSNGWTIPCDPMTLDGPAPPTDNPEGTPGSVDIPTSNSPGYDTVVVTSPDPGITITNVDVNDAGTMITVDYETDPHSDGDSYRLDFVTSYDPGNNFSVPDAIQATNAVPEILSIVWTDIEGSVLAGPEESILLVADIYTKNSDFPSSGPPYPVDPGALFVMGGSGFSIIRKWFIAYDHFRVLLDVDDGVGGEVSIPGSGTAFSITINNTDAVGYTENLKFIPTKPTIHWVTSSDPSWPGPGTYLIDVYGYNFRDTSFATPTTFVMDLPHVVNSVNAYVSSEQVTLDVTIVDLGGGFTDLVKLGAQHGSYVEAPKGVQYSPDVAPPSLTGATPAPLNPQVEGQVTELTLAGGSLPEAQYRVQPFYNSGSPAALDMNRILDLSIPSPTQAFLKLFVDHGYAGVDIKIDLDKPGQPTATTNAPTIAVQPTPTSDDAWSGGVYPGATGILAINDPSINNNYLPGIGIYTEAGGVEILLGLTQWVDANNLTTTYTIPLTATPGDAINVTITNPTGPSHTWTSRNVADFPVVIDRAVWEELDPMEGRTDVPGKVYCENLDPAAVVTVPSGATLVSYNVVGQVAEVVVSFAQLSGGTIFSIQIDNPTPVPSSDSVNQDILVEPDPIIGVYISPPTPGAARTIRLVGSYLYPPDAHSAGIIPSLTLSTNLAWDSAKQSFGEWEGLIDITGTPGQKMDLSLVRPSGRAFAKTDVFTILPLDLIPSGITADPTDLISTALMTVEINGTNLDSVRSIDLECEQPDRQPIGSSARVPCTIVGATSSIIRFQCVVPTGNLSLTYKALFYNRFLDLLHTKTGLFTVVKSTKGPRILNKATLWAAVNVVQGITQTLTVSVDPATPITDKNTEIVGTNIALVSVTDISPGGAPGTVFDVEFTNGAAGQEAELAFYNKQVVPEEKDVLRWTIST